MSKKVKKIFKESADYDKMSDFSRNTIVDTMYNLSNNNDGVESDHYKEYTPYIELIDDDILKRDELIRSIYLTKDIESPSFRIIAGKLEPVKKLYNISLPNEMQFLNNDWLILILRIPTEIDEYEIINNDDIFTNLDAKLIIDSNQGVTLVDASYNENSTHYIKYIYACGWITLFIPFNIGESVGPNININGICNMQYAIYYDSFDLYNKNTLCYSKSRYYKLDYTQNACLYFEAG